ncbi:MAG TPA: dihydroorotate dehydrogenase electron transfer subunit [Bacteroidales bacterium]|nr:dihydroorotate dehydrogenase electron transfer subunit [Bacteroidales bacterium]
MKRIQDCTISKITWLNTDSYLLELDVPDEIPVLAPGQFAEIRIGNSPDVFLRRPFSFLDADVENRKLVFFIKRIGKGTRHLGELHPGETVNIIYPLGNHFQVPEKGNVLIVGGGSGIAPFILLGKELQKKGVGMTFLLGGKAGSDILLTDRFSQYGDVLITTEDGSKGEKGMVTDHSVFTSDPFPFTMIYACGPEPMMKAVARMSCLKNIPCEVSLENLMACGFGVCLCCIVETTEGNLCVCTEGPVFNTNRLKWQICA